MKTLKQTEPLYDVVAVTISTCKVRAFFGERKTLPNAEAIVNMAVMRRGVDEEFYAEAPTGKFKAGDVFSNE